ncbi:two-component system histidine kinase PnpS [Cohnella nanjingensis]|uniref:histidine kinase n=1 Tax=Cohnella nanjingensis TaxID=1387779 RepID=A0A7X0RRN1_9BACL|nr:ATP-binding protein [Cohnella nanjingensis]MBB6671029.1 HAMP domain-containing protein [Cohnella nanjingensis]
MRKFRFKLTALFMLLIGLSVLAAGIFTGKSYKDNHQEALRDHMVKELRVLIAAAPWPNGEPEAAQRTYLQEQAERFKSIADMRVTYIRTDGVVLGDSDHAPETMDNHLGRKEVKQALAAGEGSSIRHSDTLGQNMLYVAMAVKDDAGQPVGIIRLAMSLKDVERSLGNMWIALVFGLALVFALAALVSYRVALSVTRPLERMTAAAKRMADMDYAIRIPDAGRDEVSELARALNAMAGSLQGHMDEIRQNESQLQSVLDNMISGVVMIGPDGKIQLYNRSAELLLGSTAKERVGRSYTEAKQQYELLQIIREGLDNHEPLHEELTVYYPEERLLELNLVPMRMGEDPEPGLLLVMQDVTAIRRLERMRSEFVANVSHELKTPVAAVKGFAETLLAGAVNDPETAHSFLTIIHDESERLNRLIGDILELSKIESRRSPLQFSPVDLKIFLERQVEFMRAEAARKNIAMELQVEEELFLEADEDRLGQILLNLLQNGINYTPDGGRVKIVAEYVDGADSDAGEDRVRISVSDTGIGIPKKDIPRIFERFYRVDKARSRSSGGTGLGLSIVKHLVELHHGSIRVESTVGVGTRFILELPLLQP